MHIKHLLSSPTRPILNRKKIIFSEYIMHGFKTNKNLLWYFKEVNMYIKHVDLNLRIQSSQFSECAEGFTWHILQVNTVYRIIFSLFYTFKSFRPVCQNKAVFKERSFETSVLNLFVDKKSNRGKNITGQIFHCLQYSN